MLPAEQRRFISPTALRLTSSERNRLILGFANVFLCTLFAILYMALDYMVFQFMESVHIFFSENTAVDVPDFFDVSVRGAGTGVKTQECGGTPRGLTCGESTMDSSWIHVGHGLSFPGMFSRVNSIQSHKICETSSTPVLY